MRQSFCFPTVEKGSAKAVTRQAVSTRDPERETETDRAKARFCVEERERERGREEEIQKA